jgi:hypothetical protein
VGDRRLHAVLPPLFDAPTSRGLYDDSTGVLWAADSFACPTPGPLLWVDDIPTPMYDDAFPAFNSMIAPWLTWVDTARYRAHVDAVEGLGLSAVASCHGPILTGAAIPDAFDRIRALAGAAPVPSPGQDLLDELLAAATAAA